jgi:cell division transport system permease protein
MSRVLRIVGYFFTEATQSLRRSWKTSSVAGATIGVSLLLCGGAMMAAGNMASTVEGWQQEVAVVVYLSAGSVASEVDDLRFVLEAPSWVEEVVAVSSDEAARRFEASFPTLATHTEVWEGELFPASLEADIDPDLVDAAQFDEWMRGLRSHPATLMADADQDWLAQLAVAVRTLRFGGMALGALLLAAAALTTSSILRLIAHLYEEEIAIMRLVGATEFYIRGPFYVEGLLLGLGGALFSALTLVLGTRALPASEGSLWAQLVFSRPAGPGLVAALLLLGAGVGLLGAILSLRRENLGAPPAAE